MTSEQIQEIEPMAAAAAGKFCTRLRQIDPSSEAFPHALLRGDAPERGRKLMQVLRVAVKAARRPPLVPAVHAMGILSREQYTTVGATLLWALEGTVGESFTDSLRNLMPCEQEFWFFLGVLAISAR